VPRSLVGTLLSFDDFEEDVCGHAPHDVARRLTLEFSRPGPTVFRDAELELDSPKPGQIVDLTNFFPAEAIRAALLDKAEVRDRLGDKAPPATLDGLRLGILDNTKWNANRLLRKTADRLGEQHRFAVVHYYKKESFSKNADPALLAQIVAENDIVLTAIGD